MTRLRGGPCPGEVGFHRSPTNPESEVPKLAKRDTK